MNAFAQSLLFALAAAFANILGGVIVSSGNWAYRSLRYFVALGSGFMLGTVFLEMLPESLTLTNSAPVLLLVGYLIVHTFEHTFASHLHFGVETHHEEVVNPIVGISALIGMIVHTFFDGVAIGAGFMISPRVGILIFLAVLLHKIPDGFTIASIVITWWGSWQFIYSGAVSCSLMRFPFRRVRRSTSPRQISYLRSIGKKG